ncbi:hypothetical protein HD554DRAFT_2113906 [Boletus coccyginus]|nr:hypothetical protein HD554DRAFT_2113906 [Boletus coccyginus]
MFVPTCRYSLRLQYRFNGAVQMRNGSFMVSMKAPKQGGCQNHCTERYAIRCARNAVGTYDRCSKTRSDRWSSYKVRDHTANTSALLELISTRNGAGTIAVPRQACFPPSSETTLHHQRPTACPEIPRLVPHQRFSNENHSLRTMILKPERFRASFVKSHPAVQCFSQTKRVAHVVHRAPGKDGHHRRHGREVENTPICLEAVRQNYEQTKRRNQPVAENGKVR